MKEKISLFIEEELGFFLVDKQLENIYKRLLFLVYEIINEKAKEGIKFDIDEFITNILYSLCNLVLKVIIITIFFNRFYLYIQQIINKNFFLIKMFNNSLKKDAQK